MRCSEPGHRCAAANPAIAFRLQSTFLVGWVAGTLADKKVQSYGIGADILPVILGCIRNDLTGNR